MKIMLAVLVLLNGQAIKFKDTQPIKDGGFVLVPLRGVFEKMGAKVSYEPTTRNIIIRREGTIVETAVGRMHAWVNGDEVALDLPVRLQNGRVLVPIRFVAENFGAHVGWNSTENTVFINTEKGNGNPNQPPAPAIRAGEIEVRASSDKKTYRAGETVKISIVAQNQDDRPREITYGSGQSFDVTITPVGEDTPRWDWSHGRAFTMMLRTQTLAPGERLTFSTTWDQKDNEGNVMPRGEYSVAGRLAVSGVAAAPNVSITLGE